MEMKKIVIAVCLFMGTVSAYAQQRSMQEVDSIANSVFHTPQAGARSVTGLMQMSVKSSQVLKADSLVKREAFYVYTPASSTKGFIIVSGDERMPAVLGYSEESPFEADSLPDGLKWYLRKCGHDASLLSKQSPEVTRALRAAQSANGQTRAVQSVAPLLGGRVWNQGYPFNNHCPIHYGELRTVTGCVATAMAQIMAHHKYPEKGTGHIYYTTKTDQIEVNVDLDNEIPYDWENMLDSYEDEDAFNSVQADAVAQLMYHVGAASQMDYTYNGSGAIDAQALAGMVNHFKYDDEMRMIYRADYDTEVWHSLLQAELLANRPIYYSGSDENTESGHAFVFDGIDEEGLYHVNWGWGGMCNGYYSIYDLTPDELGIGSGDFGDYSFGCAAIINIRPDNGVADSEPTNMRADYIQLTSNIGLNEKGEEISLNMSRFENCSYLAFNGKVQLMLTDDEDKVVAMLGNPSEVSGLPSGWFYYNLGVSAILPDNLADGRYRLYVGVCQDGYEEWGTVKSCIYHSTASTDYDYLDVVVQGDKYTIGTGETPDASEQQGCVVAERLSFLKGETGAMERGRELYIEATGLRNLYHDSFSGTIAAVLTYGNDKFVAPLEYQNVSDSCYSGRIPESLPNGIYRLHLGYLPEGEEKWELVMCTDESCLPYTTIFLRDSYMSVGLKKNTKTSFEVKFWEAYDALPLNGEYRAKLLVTNTGSKSEFCYNVMFVNALENGSIVYPLLTAATEVIEPNTTKTIDVALSLGEYPGVQALGPGKYYIAYSVGNEPLSILQDSEGNYVCHEIELLAPEGIGQMETNAPVVWRMIKQIGQEILLKPAVDLAGWEVTSTLGVVVARGHDAVDAGGDVSIDLGYCPTGIYQLRGFGKDGEVYVMKFLKE